MTKLAAGSTGAALARIALRAACSVDGVVGPARSHLDASRPSADAPVDERLQGIDCIPLPEGAYRVELHLVASMVSLPELAERVRDRVERAVARAGLSSELGSIDVAFDDIDPSERPPRRSRRPLRPEKRP